MLNVNVVSVQDTATINFNDQDHQFGPVVSSLLAESKTAAAVVAAPDPFQLISSILDNFITQKTDDAAALAEEIRVLSEAAAEINRLFGLLMQDRLPLTDPNTPGTKVPLGGSTVARGHLTELDRIIRSIDPEKGISEITGFSLSASITTRVSYTQLQTMNATMTAYTDTLQVDINSKEQLFTNSINAVTSGQDELRDIRQFISNLSRV